jgi:hypothetical protein
MPLNQPKGYDLRFAPYELKVRIVEQKCIGCGFYTFEGSDEKDIPVYGCEYPSDIEGLNGQIREPYLTIVEIASNICCFWCLSDPEVIDSEPGDWSDPALVPNGISAISVVIGQLEFYYGKRES